MSPRVTRLSSIIHPKQIHCLFFAQAGQPLEVLYSIPCIGQDNHVTAFLPFVMRNRAPGFFLIAYWLFRPTFQPNSLLLANIKSRGSLFTKLLIKSAVPVTPYNSQLVEVKRLLLVVILFEPIVSVSEGIKYKNNET